MAVTPHVVFANNATSLLAAPAPAGSTQITIEAADVVWFPPPDLAGTGFYFYATLEDRRVVPTRREIVKVIGRSNATFTVVRAQENTASHDFFTGAIFSHRLTAAGLYDQLHEETLQRIVADQAEALARGLADENIGVQLTAEENARFAGDNALQAQLNNEIARAQNAETALASAVGGSVGGETARAKAAEAALQAAIDAETARAKAAEAALTGGGSTSVTAETTRALAAEAALGTRIDGETARATGAEAHLQSEVDALNALNSVLVQGGQGNASSGHVRVGFPRAFSNCFSCVASASGTGYTAISILLSFDNNGADIYAVESNNTPAGCVVNWMAVGSV